MLLIHSYLMYKISNLISKDIHEKNPFTLSLSRFIAFKR